MKRLVVSILAVTGVMIAAANEASAHPGFARKYKISCTACHSPVPKLNDFGERFRTNGYQFPGTMEDEPAWDQNSMPIDLMLHEMATFMSMKNNMAVATPSGIPPGKKLEVSSFRHLSIEFFSGGVVAPHLSYLAYWEIEAERQLVGGKFETSAELVPHQTQIIYNNILNSGFGYLNARMGLFEVELPFSRHRNLFSHDNGQLVYGISPVQGGFNLGSMQLGASLFGRYEGFEYEAALVNGTNDSFDTNTAKDVFLRAGYTIYEPCDFLESIRFGGVASLGRENLATNVSEDNTDFVKFGFDLSFQLSSAISLSCQWLMGIHDDTDGTTVGDQEFRYDGFFVQGDVMVLTEQLYLIGRYDRVNVRDQWEVNPMVVSNTGNEDSLSRISMGLKYYLTPGTFLHLEYFIGDNGLGYPAAANGAGRVTDVDMGGAMLMVVIDW